MQTLESILSEFSLFNGFEQRYIQLIAGCASDVRFNSGEIILREGEEANQFYIIRHGKVALEMAFVPEREPITIHTIERVMCSAGHASSHHTDGVSVLGPSHPPKPLSWTGSIFA